MKRNKLMVGILFAGLLVTASTSFSYKKNPNATLSGGSIVFHVNDDDKDDNSTETVTVTCSGHLAGDLQSIGSGTVWHDQTNIPPLALNNIDNGIEQSDCSKIHVTIDHSTKGNDNFKFNVRVYLNFGSSRFTYSSGDLVLTKDRGHWEGDLSKT